MEFDEKELWRIKEELHTTSRLVEEHDPGKLRELEGPLNYLMYDLERLVRRSGAVSAMDIQVVTGYLATIQAELTARIEAGEIPKELIDFAFHALGRLSGIDAQFGYYMSK